MMSKFILSLCLTFTISTLCFAQDFEISGTVTDQSTNLPLPGVNIILKGTTNGVTTDFDGNFTIANVAANSTLVFSYLGYQTQEILVTGSDNLSVILVEDLEALDEVVVIGYGTQKKKETTGAVSVISSETIEALEPVRIEQALQGQVAGVNITSQSGAPGAASNIRIRGISTNGDNDPLILVDGNIVVDLSVINPSDIESINVLKDATAGIYGVRGANGVILITTKSGKINTDFKFTVNTYGGVQSTTRKIPLLNATEYALLANEAFAASGDDLPFPDASNLGQGTNWQDEVFEDAGIYSVDFTINKGTEKSTYSLGASYLDQDGIVGNDKANFNRTTAKFNFGTKFFDRLKLTTSSIFFNTNRKGLPENGIGSVLFNALNMPPTLSVRDTNGDFTLTPGTGLGIEVVNPLAQIANAENETGVNKFSGSYALNYEFLDYFSVETRYQFNYAEVKGKTLNREVYYGPSKVFNTVNSLEALDDDVNSSQVSEFEQTFKDYTFDAFIKYERIFNEVHDFKLLLGTSVFRSQGINDVNLTGFGANGDNLDDVSVGGADSSQDNLELSGQPRRFFDSRLLSYFSRLQYNYDGKYLFSAVIRRDGSSNFGPENKFGYFPTASIGWVLSEENFLKDSDNINLMKLRASYGIIGNDKIPTSFGFVSLLTGEGVYVFDNQLTFGSALGAIANPEIKWERQIPFDIGLDLRLFNSLDITMDYFNKKTEDLLVTPEVSGILGSGAPGSAAPIVNAGTVENKGFEFSVGYRKTVSEDFDYSINYNFTTLENNVLFVGSDTGVIQGGQFGIGQEPPSRMEEGFPIGYFYGLQTDGIFQSQAEVDAHASQVNAAPGDLRYVDTNNDGIINGEDRTYIGDPIADVTMGMNVSFQYKNFDFSAYAFASIGNEIVRNYERTLPLTNRSVYYLDRWTGTGSTDDFPRVTTGANSNNLFSDFWVEDGSFVRLQNIQLGYNFGAGALEKFKMDKLRLYVSASNLFTLTEYQGYDPTTSNGDPIGQGIDFGFYPNPRTVLLGLNVKF